MMEEMNPGPNPNLYMIANGGHIINNIIVDHDGSIHVNAF
jgi:hypothetical protein